MEQPVQIVVSTIEDALNNALVGEVIGVAMVCVHVHDLGGEPAGRSVGTCWAGAAEDDLLRLVGGLEVLKMRILRDIEDARESEGEQT